MGEARKLWQRSFVLTRLKEIHRLLNEVKSVADAGEMPARLRKNITETTRKVSGTTRSLHNWAITKKEKVDKEFKKPRRR